MNRADVSGLSVINYASKLIAAVLVFSQALLPVAYSSPVTPQDAAFQNAQQLLEDDKLLEAERQLTTALERDPANYEYHFELANVYARWHDIQSEDGNKEGAAEKLSASERALRQTLMVNPYYIPAHYNLGIIYKRQEKYEDAREQFKKLLRLTQEEDDHYAQVNTMMQIGSTYEEQGFFDDAVDVYKEAREIDYYNPSIMSAIEDAKESKKEYEASKRRDPDLFLSRYRAFRYTPESHASLYQQRTLNARNQSSGFAQILPFLGTMLAQQFMQARNSRKSSL